MNPWGRPSADEYAAYYARYIAMCPGEDLFAALAHASEKRADLVRRINPDSALHRYAPGKWRTIDVLQHMIDCERIFAYRALRFARNDLTDLPGFEENDYADEAAKTTRPLADVTDEMELVRRSTIGLFRGFGPDTARRKGKANGNPFSVRALGWAIVGHELHHVKIINERYLAHAAAQHP
jgi:DinB superfamily